MAGMPRRPADPFRDTLRATPNARRAPQRVHASRTQGVTLIELIVVVAILGVLLASAVPSFVKFMSNHRASTAVNDLLHGIALARSEALKRTQRVYIAPIAGRWRNGWAVFVDRNDNRAFDALTAGVGDELIARHDALPASIVISSGSGSVREPFTDAGSPARPYVMFDGHGFPRQRNGALNIGSIVVTDVTRSGSTIRTLCLASSGRTRIVNDRAKCT